MIANLLDAQKLFEDHYFQMHRRFPVTFVQGKGCRLYDDQGKEYLDALAGIAVDSLGHCHPNMVRAISEQAAKLIHVSNFYYNQPQSEAAKKITEISGFERAFFCNSGVEANEGAIKLVRKYAHQKGKNGKIFSFTNCFHGRSLTTIAMGKRAYQEGFDPMPEGFGQLSFNDISALEAIDNNTTAVFIEFIQGEGGVNPATPEFIEALKNKCEATDTLIVADEIQTGIGRTGKWFAFQHYNLIPDVITLAKGLGSGFPIGAVLSSNEISSVFTPGSHSSTFGGNPLACTVALEVLNTIEKEDLVANADSCGTYLMNKLEEGLNKYKQVEQVRGKGLMIGIVFKSQCSELGKILMKNGLLVSCTAGNVIRIVPPLIINQSDADEVVTKMITSVDEWIENLS